MAARQWVGLQSTPPRVEPGFQWAGARQLFLALGLKAWLGLAASGGCVPLSFGVFHSHQVSPQSVSLRPAACAMASVHILPQFASHRAKMGQFCLPQQLSPWQQPVIALDKTVGEN